MKKCLQAVLLCQLLGYPSTELQCLAWSAFSLLLLQPLFLTCLSRTDNNTICLDGLLHNVACLVFHCQEHTGGFMVKILWGVSSCAEVAPQAQHGPQPTAAFPQCSLVLGWQLWLCFCWLHKYYFKGFWKGLGVFWCPTLVFPQSICISSMLWPPNSEMAPLAGTSIAWGALAMPVWAYACTDEVPRCKFAGNGMLNSKSIVP